MTTPRTRALPPIPFSEEEREALRVLAFLVRQGLLGRPDAALAHRIHERAERAS